MGKRRVLDRLRRVEARLPAGDGPVELRMLWADEEEGVPPPAPGDVVIHLTWGDEDAGVPRVREAGERDG